MRLILNNCSDTDYCRVSHLKNFLDDDTKRSTTKSSVSESRKSGTGSINSHNNRNVLATKNPPSSTPAHRNSTSKQQSTTVPASDQQQQDDLEFDIDAEVEVEMKNMARIESARAQWRRKEEDRLEESWSALSLFDRNQKTRLSLDLENDILDEYLATDRSRQQQQPKVATIVEEDEGEGGVPAVGVGEEEFVIPELPKGRLMVINIRTTWGDRHYVGLNGIEVFTSSGSPADVESIRSEPKDINVLAEYNKDPRVVANLLDGVNRTRDDTHMWLAPYSKGKDHKVFITFKRPVQIAMMRVWVSSQ